MMLRAPEAEALYEGIAQKGFGFLSIDGSPFPRGSTATNETTELKPRGSRGKVVSNKLMSAIINNHRGTSGSRVAHQNNKKVLKATPG
jgi:hypothetical protein